MTLLARILLYALDLYFWIIVISVIVSWLVAFEVLNVRNRQAANIVRLLEKATDPVFRPLRKYIPSIGGIDVTPIIVIFGIYLAKDFIFWIAY